MLVIKLFHYNILRNYSTTEEQKDISKLYDLKQLFKTLIVSTIADSNICGFHLYITSGSLQTLLLHTVISPPVLSLGIIIS